MLCYRQCNIFPSYTGGIIWTEHCEQCWNFRTVRGLETELELGCRTGPPGIIVWRPRFIGIDSWAP